MNLETFTNMDGRIGRQTFWIAMIIMIVISIILYFILGAIFGTGMGAMDPARMAEPGFMEGYMRSASIMQLIMLALTFWPITAIMSKRLNDRDRPSWMKWLFWVPSVLSALLGLAGLMYTMTDMGGIQMPTPTTIGMILSLLSLAVGIWALVEMGILRGTDGTNQHGSDPTA